MIEQHVPLFKVYGGRQFMNFIGQYKARCPNQLQNHKERIYTHTEVGVAPYKEKS